MKRLLVSATAMAVLACVTTFAGTAYGQTQPGAASKPHKVGLIDMAHIFKNYKKFEALREDLKTEIEASDAQAKQMAAEAQRIQQELQSKTFAEGSPEWQQREKALLRLKADFEAFRQNAQREFLKKESTIYKTIYLEVADAVQKYAHYYNYTVVLRFSREGLEDTEDPREVLQGMNKQVVFHRPEDDITESVLDYLNRQYAAKAGGAAPRTSSAPAGTTRN